MKDPFTKKDVETIIEANENPPPPTEELVEVVNSYKEFVNPLDKLKKDTSRRGIDIDNEGNLRVLLGSLERLLFLLVNKQFLV